MTIKERGTPKTLREIVGVKPSVGAEILGGKIAKRDAVSGSRVTRTKIGDTEMFEVN